VYRGLVTVAMVVALCQRCRRNHPAEALAVARAVAVEALRSERLQRWWRSGVGGALVRQPGRH